MNPSPINNKVFIACIVFSFMIVLCLFFASYFDTRTTVVFCDVGQGDASYIRIENKIDVLIDTGSAKNTVLQCLGKHMPFYDRTLEYIFISHPQSDHAGGLFELMKRYEIKTLLLNSTQFNTSFSRKLSTAIKEKNISKIRLFAGNSLALLQTKIHILAPDKRSSSKHVSDINNESMVLMFTLPNYHIFFTGDASGNILNSLKIPFFSGTTIVKIPHHGSKYGLARQFYSLAQVTEAVLSVGKNNPYGHPHNKVIDYLKSLKIHIRRTDEEGDIVYKF